MQLSISPIECIANDLHPYSTVLVKEHRDRAGSKKPHIQIGSGTFVTIGDVYGILTAQHVAGELEGDCALGLALIKHEHIHLTECRYRDVIHAPSAVSPADVQDLAFMVLPAPSVSATKAVKSFYDLVIERDKLLPNPPALDWGIWFPCGARGEKTAEEESALSYDGGVSFGGMFYAAGADRAFEKEGYDYIELGVEYQERADLPSTFGSMSGGMWHVPVRQLEGGTLEPTGLLLSREMFYKSPIENQRRFARCHGRRSIYEQGYSAVKIKYPPGM